MYILGPDKMEDGIREDRWNIKQKSRILDRNS